MRCTTDMPGATRVLLTPQTWALIRSAYEGGATAPSLKERYGCGVSTIYGRAVREGWSKTAARDRAAACAPPVEAKPDPEVARPEPEAAAVMATPSGPREAAVAAMALAGEEMAQGRPNNALAFARLAEVIARVADRLDPIPAAQDETRAGDADLVEMLKARLDALAADRRTGGWPDAG